MKLLRATRQIAPDGSGGRERRLPGDPSAGNNLAGRALMALLWTPPSAQEKSSGKCLCASSGCSHLSGLCCGRQIAAGPYGSSKVGSRSK